MKRAKYGNRKTVVDGITFDSDREAKRYAVLKLRERAGEITDLELQPKFPCIVNGNKICVYKADFRYWDMLDPENPERTVEDVKGYRTREYILKKKLVEALYPGTKIMEV